MTRNEAVKEIKALRMQYMINVQAEDVDSAFRTSNALGIAITALSGPTREQMEKLRGEVNKIDKFLYACSKCGAFIDKGDSFCCRCGVPLTDGAVDIVMQRLEALKDEAN